MTGPCAGLTVVEVAVGASELGLGPAAGVPGMALADLGADVIRVTGTRPVEIDLHVPWGRAWHRDKRIVPTDDPGEILGLMAAADVALVYGPEHLVEGRHLGYRDVMVANPSLVYARCRPSRTSRGTVEDFALLVEAGAGFCTQLAGHRPGPVFIDARAAGAGAALLMLNSVLALLRRREETAAGGWAETSLYDGMLATLGCMIGRSERAAPEVESYWEKGSTFPNFLYRCADGELIQVWFGGKGMYAKLIEVLGDEPSEQGYYTDQVTGALNDRAVRWRTTFAERSRQEWVDRLRAAGVACEPVLGPGQALTDRHLVESGLAVERADGGSDGGPKRVYVVTPISVGPLVPDVPVARPSPGGGAVGAGMLQGIRVLDFSAFVAGPLAAQVLADMGADVVKVEPPSGEAMRAAAYAVAACQRGKRSVAIDINAPEARLVIERLIARSDVVLHNFRVGVAERIGIDQAAVARINPRAVYCHASAFGVTGSRARYPGNDALMQALTGFERAIGGEGNDPIAATWIPIDMTGGWLAAAGILAGLYHRARTGAGAKVTTSLLGAGMLLHSGVHLEDGRLVDQPLLDRAQTGYGAGYRIYRAGDDRWFALVVPDRACWARLRSVPGLESVPEEYAPVRRDSDDPAAIAAERALEAAFSAGPAAGWLDHLQRQGIPATAIEPLDRDRFRRAILDDPINRQIGRVASYHTPEWGHFEQIGPLIRCGPDASGHGAMMLPAVGEHTLEVLTGLGLEPAAIAALVDAKVVLQHRPVGTGCE